EVHRLRPRHVLDRKAPGVEASDVARAASLPAEPARVLAHEALVLFLRHLVDAEEEGPRNLHLVTRPLAFDPRAVGDPVAAEDALDLLAGRTHEELARRHGHETHAERVGDLARHHDLTFARVGG